MRFFLRKEKKKNNPLKEDEGSFLLDGPQICVCVCVCVRDTHTHTHTHTHTERETDRQDRETEMVVQW